MPKQPNTRDFEVGDRIISHGEFAGTLIEKYDSHPTDQIWKIKWDDGAEDAHIHESRLAYLNGGPDSGHHTQPVVIIPDADLREMPGEGPKFPDDTFVQSADGSVWRVEPDFGWDCVSSGSAALIGPARLLVMGGQE